MALGSKKKKSKGFFSGLSLGGIGMKSKGMALDLDGCEDEVGAWGCDDSAGDAMMFLASAECSLGAPPSAECSLGAPRCRSMRRSSPAPKVGSACAARVSGGSEFDTWKGLTAKAPKRNPSEHVTCTVVIYNAVSGGVPSEADVIAAIDDLEQLYAACSTK